MTKRGDSLADLPGIQPGSLAHHLARLIDFLTEQDDLHQQQIDDLKQRVHDLERSRLD